MNTAHNFTADLERSHSITGAAFWEDLYRGLFPDLQAIHAHNEDGQGQRAGVDRTVILSSGKTLWVDEKVRYRDFPDIALEEWTDFDRGIPGWIQKRLLCHYFCYVNLPGGKAYLLPTEQTQQAWREHSDEWKATREPITALNRDPRTGRKWESVSWGIQPEELFPAIGQCLRVTFDPSTNGLNGGST
mgnify:CR=1 FL=1